MRKTTVSFVMSVRPSVHRDQLGVLSSLLLFHCKGGYANAPHCCLSSLLLFHCKDGYANAPHFCLSALLLFHCKCGYANAPHCCLSSLLLFHCKGGYANAPHCCLSSLLLFYCKSGYSNAPVACLRVWISEETCISWSTFITETECVYFAVRTGSLNIIQVIFCF